MLATVLKFVKTDIDYSYIVLAIYALLGQFQAIQALMLCFLFGQLNPNLDINSSRTLFGLVIGSSIISIFFHLQFSVLKKNFSKIFTFCLFTFIFNLFLITHAIFFSQLLFVSTIKTMFWSLLSMSLLIAFHSLSSKQELELKKNFFWLFSILILSSLFSYFVPNISFGHGSLMGIFNHPQGFGIILSVFSSILLVIVLNQKNFNFKTLFLFTFFILCLFLIYLTSSRTSFLSLLFSFGTLFCFSIFYKKDLFLSTYSILYNKKFKLYFITFLLPIIFFCTYNYEYFFYFMNKYSNNENVIETYFIARAPAIDPVINNLKLNWFTGIGFGVPSSYNLISSNVDEFNVFNFSRGEKGNIFLLVFEELGILGLLIFISWLAVLFKQTIISANNISIIIILNIVFINLAEAVLFSPGGYGLFLIILLCYATTKSNSILAKQN